MDKKLKATLVVATATVAALSTNTVKADETQASETTATVENVASEAKVTAQDVKDSAAKADQAQAAVNNQEKVVSDRNVEVQTAITNETKLSDSVKQAEAVTPEILEQSKKKVAQVTSELESAQNLENQAKSEDDKAKSEVKTAEVAVNEANQKLSLAEGNKKSAETKVADLSKVVSLSEAETAKQKADSDLANAILMKETAERELQSARQADDSALKNKAVKESELKTAQATQAAAKAELEKLGQAPKSYDFSEVKFTLGKEFADALNKRAELMGEYDGRSNELSSRNPQEVSQNAQKLRDLASKMETQNQYKSKDSDNVDVDLWNLTDDQKTEINLFGLEIVNQIRQQLGNPQLKTTVGMQDFAFDVAKKRTESGIQNDGYDYKGLNDSAKAHGLSYANGDNGHQPNIIKANDQDFDKTADLSKKDRHPQLKMSALKEMIYNSYKKFMFKSGFENNANRQWEHALSVGGSISFRKDHKDGSANRKASAYNSTSVTATLMGPYGNTTFFNVFVINFQTAPKFEGEEDSRDLKNKNSNVTNEFAKFDDTEIKNDSTAIREYNLKKSTLQASVDAADKAVAQAQVALNTANTYQPQVASAQTKLNQAIVAFDTATKNANDAQKRLDELSATNGNQAESLKKAQAELAKAQTEVTTAHKELVDAQSKLKELQAKENTTTSALNQARTTVATKQVELNKVNQTVKELETAQGTLERLKPELERAKQNRVVAEKALEDAQSELKRLSALNEIAQSEKEDVLARYRRQNPITDKGESWIEPALPEFPMDKLPLPPKENDGENSPIYNGRPVVRPTSNTAPYSHYPSSKVVTVNNRRRLPNTGENTSLGTIAMGIVLAVSAYGLVNKRKED